MFDVVAIYEENHGFIGLANNYYNAVKWLINGRWLTDDSDVYNPFNHSWKTVKEAFGDNWRELMLNEWDEKHFCEVFDGCFYFRHNTVYLGE